VVRIARRSAPTAATRADGAIDAESYTLLAADLAA
jgi:hypothetical protein